MNSAENDATLAFRNAYRALKNGDRVTARSWAFRAVALWPDYEEPWLLLAAISSPSASVAYLARALQIHPVSPRALAGMQWAQKRRQVQLETALSANSRLDVALVSSSPIRPKLSLPRLAVLATAAGVVLIALLAAAILPGWNHASPAGQAVLPTATATIEYKTVVLDTPSLAQQFITPSASPTAEITLPTLTATSEPTQTSTFTDTPEPTQTASFTATFKPTSTKKPAPARKTSTPPATTYIVRRGDTLIKIAASFGVSVQSLVQANKILNPSLIKAGQNLTIPRRGASVPAQAATSQKRIVVDLSEQHLYAYQDNQLVFSFVVSTGRGNGTLAGNFRILDKDSNAWSDPWGFWMPYWMGIYYVGSNLENGIHSLPVLTNGAQIWGDAIGTPVSYGCVVLRPEDARQLFNWANIRTPVQIKY